MIPLNAQSAADCLVPVPGRQSALPPAAGMGRRWALQSVVLRVPLVGSLRRQSQRMVTAIIRHLPVTLVITDIDRKACDEHPTWLARRRARGTTFWAAFWTATNLCMRGN